MAVVTLSKFSSITTQVPVGTSIDSISISYNTGYIQPVLDIELPEPILILEGTLLTIKPDQRWPEGITIEILVDASTLVDSYLIPPNLDIYNPEEQLYTEGILHQATYSDLEIRGIITSDEESLLRAMGPKLTALLDSLYPRILKVFSYNGIRASAEVARALCLRRLQYLAHLLNLSSLVESILLSPGPTRDSFLSSYMPSARQDSEAVSKLREVQADIIALRNAITQAGLNTEVISSIDYEIDKASDPHFLAECIVTLFCALRYTHDNPKFRY